MKSYKLTKQRLKYLMFRQKINWKVEKVLKKRFFIRNFGKKFTKKAFAVKNRRLDYLEVCYEYIKNDFEELIKEYANKFEEFTLDTSFKNKDKYIWICWFQGEKDMPDIVKICIDSIKKNVPNDVKVILITAENIYDYISVPLHIQKKVYTGKITLTHFSDMVRFELLSRYGGLWLDATIYVSESIPESIFDKELYSIHYADKGGERNDFYGLLTSFLIGGNRETSIQLFFKFMLEFFYTYWEKYSILIDWHLINIAYALLYRNIEQMKILIDNIDVVNIDIQQANRLANEPFDENEWQTMTGYIFHKMNWRNTYIEKNNEEITYYKKMEELARIQNR